jgi:Chaperone of endosialidase/Head domain of trimeric autotransporter adhesin
MKYKNKNITKTFFLLCLTIVGIQKINAQQAVGINTTTPHPSSVLDITSADKGILIPRLSTTARTGISSPAKGLMLYDSTAKSFYFYDGFAWATVGNSQLEKIMESGKTGYRILGRDTTNYGDIGNGAIDLSKQNNASNATGAVGDNSVALGLNTIASGSQSTAMGEGTLAYGTNAVAMGQETSATDAFSLATGFQTGASGVASTAMGFQSLATGNFSNANGFNTISSGFASSSMGYNSISFGGASVSMGDSTRAQSYAEVAIGSNNTRYTAVNPFGNNIADRAFVVGIGNGIAGNTNRYNDGLIVYKDGTIELDTLATAPAITSNRLFVQNKKLRYNGSILNTSELEKITENGKTGYRILGNDANNYGNIGDYAIDLSSQSMASNTTGSTGDYSISAGYNTTASGVNAIAFGNGTTASGYLSTAMGLGTNAQGDMSTSMGADTYADAPFSTAMGISTQALSWGETAIGSFNTLYNPVSFSNYSPSDRAFVVGIGDGFNNRKDGFILYKNGTIQLNMLPSLPSNVSGKLYAFNNKLHFNGALLNTSELEKITENGKTGYRLLGANAINYAKIGNSAIDLSYQSAASAAVDSIGNYAFNAGYNTKSSGLNATAFGSSTIASGYASNATGVRTNALGDVSSSLGFETSALGIRSLSAGSNTIAKSWSEMAVGGFNTDYTAIAAYNFNIADRAFVVGIGNGIAGNSGEKNDGFIVHKNGTVELDVMAAAPTTVANRIYNVGNTLYINGVVVGAQTSDVRFKERIESLPSTLSALKKLRPVSFYWKNNKWGSQKEIGFIAQELKEQFPEVVSTDADGFCKVNYGLLTSVLTKALQEQQTEIDDFKNDIEKLKKDNEELKALMQKIIEKK